MTKRKRWAKELSVLALLIMAVTFGMDILRAPRAPANLDTVPLQTLTGDNVSLIEKSQQRPLLVYFWATWCGICKMTTPSVNRMAGEGENVLTVALRSGDEDSLTRYLRAKGVDMPVVNDPRGALSAQWDMGVTPTYVIIDKGRVVATTTGWTSYLGLKARMGWARL